MKKILSASLITTALLCSVSMATAETFNHWTYTVDGAFSNPTYDSGKKGAVKIETDFLKWGENNRIYSSLTINTGSDSSTDTKATALTHKNSAIDWKYRSLTGASLSLSFDLDSVNGVALDLDPFRYSFDFIFSETLNNRGNPNDTFAVITSDFTPISEETSFLYGDDYYLLKLALDFDTFTYNNDTYYGFSTAEGQMSMLDFTWSVELIDTIKLNDPSPTPEPATMLLMGIGLAGMGYVKRRRT